MEKLNDGEIKPFRFELEHVWRTQILINVCKRNGAILEFTVVANLFSQG